MLFKEYDSAAHIASEKEISYEEGFEDGLRQAEQDITKEKERADKLLTSLILSYHAQNKSPEEIAALSKQAITFPHVMACLNIHSNFQLLSFSTNSSMFFPFINAILFNQRTPNNPILSDQKAII